MLENCNCIYCKENVNEYFCSSCFYNYNECESNYVYKDKEMGNIPSFGHPLCPRCVSIDFKVTDKLKDNIFRKEQHENFT